MAESADMICKNPGCDRETDLVSNLCSECHAAAQEKRRLTQIRRNIQNELKLRGVRGKYLRCSFENFEYVTDQTLKAAKELENLKTPPPIPITLTSAISGTGKTHLAVSTLRGLLLRGYENSAFVSSPWLFLDIKRSYDGAGGMSEEDVINKYCTYDFLIIDDIGAERVSDWALQLWYMIIDRRDAEERCTVFTSNLSIAEIAQSMSPRIASRMAGGAVYTLTGDDYRIKGKRRNG